MEFDPAQTNLLTLVQALKNQSSFYSLITKNEAERDQAKKILNSTKITVDSNEPDFVESKYSLKSSHPELYYLDLTEQQAIVLNSWSYFGGRKPEVLTDPQKQLLQRLKEKLAKKSTGGLVPRRNGNELASYRSQLLQWLQE